MCLALKQENMQFFMINFIDLNYNVLIFEFFFKFEFLNYDVLISKYVVKKNYKEKKK